MSNRWETHEHARTCYTHQIHLAVLFFAPFRRHLCTSSKDRTCLLWNVELGIPVVRWSGHADSVGAVAASRKPGPWNSSSSAAGAAAFVVSGAADRTLQRWDIPCRALAALEEAARDSRGAAAEVAAAAVAAETGEGGKGKGRGVGVWTPPAPLLETARRSVRAHEQDVNCVAVSPNDAVVASASQDRTVKLWNAANLELVGVLKGHKRGVWKVKFNRRRAGLVGCSFSYTWWSRIARAHSVPRGVGCSQDVIFPIFLGYLLALGCSRLKFFPCPPPPWMFGVNRWSLARSIAASLPAQVTAR